MLILCIICCAVWWFSTSPQQFAPIHRWPSCVSIGLPNTTTAAACVGIGYNAMLTITHHRNLVTIAVEYISLDCKMYHNALAKNAAYEFFVEYTLTSPLLSKNSKYI